MLKNLSVRKECFALAVLMSLAIVFGFGHKQILAEVEIQDGQVNMGLWEYTVLDDGNNKKIIQITDYGANTNLKDIVVPNANDFLANSTFTTNNSGVTASDISEVIISKAAMQKAIANANKEDGKFSISQTDGEAPKTIAIGATVLSDLFNTDVENPDNNSSNNIGQNIKKIDLTGLDTRGVTKMNRMFSGCSSLTDLTFCDNFDTSTSSVDDMSGMFSGCSNLTDLTFGDNFNTSSVTNMSGMFSGCSNLTDLTFGDNFNTSSVTNMSGMFSECNNLTSLAFSDNFDTRSVTNMLEEFRGNSQTHKVTFDAGGYIVEIQIVKSGATINPPIAPKRDDYRFAGWYKEEELKNEFDFENNTITEDTTLYAKWTNENTVTFNSNKGSNVAAQTVLSGNKITKPNDPTKEGYTFEGWCKEEELINKFDFASEIITTDITLYAKWTAKANTVTFNSNKGSNVAAQTVLNGNKITKPNDPTKEGYTFEGWYKEAKLINKFDFASEIITADITLYAKWAIQDDTATFDTNDYSWNTSSDSGSNSSYSWTSSQNTPISSLSPNSQSSSLSQQVPVKLQTKAYLQGCGDGTMKPDKKVTNAELATILTNLVRENDEIIVQNPVWYEGSISYVLKKGIMKAEDCAKPNAFATVAHINSALDNVLRVCGANPSTVNSLDASTIYGATNTNVSLSENSQTITRGQLANMIKNKFGRSKKQNSTRTFSDLSPNHPYYDAIMNAVQ